MNKRIVIMTGICACMLAVLSGCSKSEEKKDTVFGSRRYINGID